MWLNSLTTSINAVRGKIISDISFYTMKPGLFVYPAQSCLAKMINWFGTLLIMGYILLNLDIKLGMDFIQSLRDSQGSVSMRNECRLWDQLQSLHIQPRCSSNEVL